MGCDRECNCIERSLGRLFHSYGHFLGRHPWPFLIIPPIVTILLAIGTVRINFMNDLEYLYAPINAPSKSERAVIQDIFQENDTHFFTSLRKTTVDGFLQVVITTPSKGNILGNETFQAIYDLDDIIRNVEVTYNGNGYIFDNDICAKWMNDCERPDLLSILEGRNVEEVTLGYPLHAGRYLLTSQLLTVTTDDTGTVHSAEAVMLMYYGRYMADEDRKLTEAWLQKVKDVLLDYKSDVIEVVFQTSKSLEEELENVVGHVLPLFSVSYVVLFGFAIFSALMLDWVRAKPWVAFGGEIAAALAIVSALGLMSACGVPFANVVGTMPFLIIGIGLDDLFIIISAWRYTDYTLSVPERVALTFQSAAVSITLTSLTDALAFGVGSITSFKSVQLFCAYTGVAVIFAYIYTITFTGACLVFAGRREAQNKHCYTFKKIQPKSKCGEKSRIYKLFCTGGIEIENKEDEMKRKEEENIQHGRLAEESTRSRNITVPLLSVFLTDYMAPFLMKAPVKLMVIVIYAGYLGVAIWGCSQLEEGLELSSLAPENSYLVPFYDKFDQHFSSTYGLVVSVAFTDSLDYTNSDTLSQIDDTVNMFKQSDQFFAYDSAVVSWLYSFQYYLSLSSRSIAHNITSMPQFVSILRSEFLQVDDFRVYAQDIVFNSDDTGITASRFFIQAKGDYGTTDERRLLVESRKMADASDLAVTVFAPYFIFLDQFDVVLVNTMQNLAIAVGAMLLVSLLFIPSLVAVIWVTLATISICTGVIGYMALWDVSLDSVSMISLVMCIGFSVDFAAHISYHFVICKASDPKEKAKEALGRLGTPIFQGAMSTILGVLILAASNEYIFKTFFKLVFMVMVFGFFHALFLLPVILSMLGSGEHKEKTSIPHSPASVEPHSAPPIIAGNGCQSQDKQVNGHATNNEDLGLDVTEIKKTDK